MKMMNIHYLATHLERINLHLQDQAVSPQIKQKSEVQREEMSAFSQNQPLISPLPL